ncbi:MAG: NADH:flavin oxidoreductase [Oscillospiraceae bacterium]|nr:NADH:flavin oxidoreductase [Oscillospiraceae bacterium]
MLIKEPLKIKNTLFNNRIVMPPMASEKTENGRITEGHHHYYDKRCGSGHIGLVVTEHMYIMPQGQATPGQIYIGDDACIEGLRSLTDVIHRGGTKCIAQINHAGYKSPAALTGMEPVGPSAVEARLKNGDIVLPHELSADEIKEITAAFAAAAKRAKAAGYDGVEIHGAHGYLLCQFYSPLSNKRCDAYGGSLENRIRFHLEVIAAVREAVGEDFIVAIRMGGCDYTEGGSTIADCVEACRLFEQAGIDLLDLSGGHCSYQPVGKAAPYFEDMSSAVKAAVSVPVLLTGGIVDAETAERLLRENACDLVGIGRALLKDPHWPETHIYK